ncbi:MAG: sodium-dependent transporter [Candidatus Azobacteroides sp.]|nr:sodium-dependent transporter [Candidatus Azobacteroides sp.]
MKKRDEFGTQFGALLALIGSAVGLGNLWKFPYMAGKNGGAAFILLYILFMFLLCLPLMLSEFTIGRRSQANAVGAFKKLAPKSKWYFTGVLGTLTAFLILCFYSVVGGWSIKYLLTSLSFGFTENINAKEQFDAFTSSSFAPVGMNLIFLGTIIGILWTGVKNGIERYSKILMPVLFLMVLILAAYAVTLPNATIGIEFLLKPDLNSITPQVVLEALGQGLFSLSLGMGIAITYSSYIGKNENLPKLAIITIVMDLIFALLAGVAILPAVFAFGFQPNEGPGLLFVILPEVFARMPFGSIFAIVFFIVLLIAALTSAVSLLEVVVAYLSEQRKLSRKKALILSGFALGLLSTLCSLSLGVLSEFKIFNLNIFDSLDALTSTFFMPLGAFFISLFVGWKMKKEEVYDELSNSGRVKIKAFNLFIFLVRYFVPTAILIIFFNKLGAFSSFF